MSPDASLDILRAHWAQSTATTTTRPPADTVDALERLRAAWATVATSVVTTSVVTTARADATSVVAGPVVTGGVNSLATGIVSDVDDSGLPVRQRLGMRPVTKATRRCASHLDRELWNLIPAARRPGWLRGRCGRCGTFLGYLPDHAQKAHGHKRVKPC